MENGPFQGWSVADAEVCSTWGPWRQSGSLRHMLCTAHWLGQSSSFHHLSVHCWVQLWQCAVLRTAGTEGCPECAEHWEGLLACSLAGKCWRCSQCFQGCGQFMGLAQSNCTDA